MNCPYCNGEMEYGLIQSSSPIGWIKTEKRKFFYNPDLYEGAVCLSKMSAIKGSAVVAYVCRACEKLLIDYGDPTSDLNYVAPKTEIKE